LAQNGCFDEITDRDQLSNVVLRANRVSWSMYLHVYISPKDD